MSENINTLEELEVSARLDDVTEPPPPTPGEPADLDRDQREAIAQMVRRAKDAGIALTGPPGPAYSVDRADRRGRPRRRTQRAPGLRQARPDRPRQRELPQRHPDQDRAHRQGRCPRHPSPAGPQRHLRTPAGQEAATPVIGHDAMVLSLFATGLRAHHR